MEPAQPSSLPPASTPLPPESPSEEPAAKRAKPSVPPPETQEPEMTPQMRRIISEAIAQGIAAGIQQQRPSPSAVSDNTLSQGQAPPSMNIPQSLSVIEGPTELPLDEGGTPDVHGFVGLFNPALFKTLLQKAKATARIEADPAASDPALSDPNNLLFSEPSTNKDEIPCPKFFLDVVQRQWAVPGGGQVLGVNDKVFYNVAPNLLEALEMPTVDGPVVALAPLPVLSSNTDDALNPEDKRSEITLRKVYQSASWAVKSAVTASFFNRTSLIWLKQMQARIPATDLQTHEDINNLIAAAEFSADATLTSVKFASRAIASSVTARRLLWLRHWQSNMKCKWKLASAPFKGEKLFGEALEPLLKETKDKKKVLPAIFKNTERKSHFQKPSFRAADTTDNLSQPQRAYFQRPDRQSDRAGYRVRSKQQFQSKRPFGGNGSQSFPHSSRSLQSQASRGSAATGDFSPKGFDEMESDSPRNMTKQAFFVQETKNPVHTGQHAGGRLPDVTRSQALPVQSPHKDTSDTLSSPQDYPYSRPTVSGRRVDRIVLSPPRQRGSTHHDQGPSGSFRESGIHSQQQEPLASYRQDAPPISIYRDDMHSLPVPGQHQRSGEPDRIGPNGASRPRLTIVRQDGVVRLHCSRGTSAYQDLTMAPPAYSEIRQEQFNYRRLGPIRSPPGVDATDHNQHIQGNEPSHDRYGRRFSRLESPDRDPDGRRPVDRRGMTKEHQQERDSNRPRSPPVGPDHHLQPSHTDPSRRRNHQGPYEPPREHLLQMYPGRRRQRAEPS
ncbi:PREDICTED: serine/arginine repetitive matrix protein 1-like [Thamnophis sirtalis]|uniref:Serine/arginine repetitive matrix protein 1-like n=1 Tax=Thamnophis sirtalis TaxID=35019 RepID=A0A6I9WVY2_9SAUR|nr:PREDICTED: serine/arginine repetitive matrix protein 1-like [Thamnophis sirtalis]